MNEPSIEQPDPTVSDADVDSPTSTDLADHGTDLPVGTLAAPEPDPPDIAGLIRSLLREAQEQTSALRRARALLVAAELEEHMGDAQSAAEHARDAAEIAPKLSLAAAQARRLHADDDESTVRRLEATVRLAEPGPTRLHAGLVLAARLRRTGDAERAARVLDHVSRGDGANGGQESDARLELERVLHRLALGQPISGVRASEKLTQAAAVVQEVLGLGGAGSASTSGGTDSGQAPYLPLLRAARELRAGRLAEATELLLTVDPSSPDILHLRAAYLATRRDGASAAKKILLQALEAEQRGGGPSRGTWRALALMAVASGDKNLLGRVLAECDPATGTFGTDERLLLLASSGALPDLPTDEWQNLARRFGVLARALAPLGTIVEEPDIADDKYLRLGAALAADDAGRVHEGIARCLDALDQSGKERALPRLWELMARRREGDLAGQADALGALAEWEGDSARLLRALVLEALGQTGEAARAYAELSSELRGSDANAARLALVTRALDEIEGGSTHAPSTHTALPTADLTSGLLSRGSGNDEVRSLLGESKLPGSEFAWSLLEAMAGRGAHLSVPPPAEHEHPTLPLEVVLSTRSALRRATLDREGTSSALSALATRQPGDIALGVLARTFDQSLRTPVAHTSPRFLEAIDVARSCIDGSATEARSALRTFAGGDAPDPLRQVLLHLAEIAEDHEARSRGELDIATGAEAPLDRRYAYGQLAEIDAERGRPGAALLWWQTISEEWPSEPDALLAQEEALGRGLDFDALRKVQARLIDALPGPEADAYRRVLAAVALGRLDLRAAERQLEPLLDRESPSLLALRVLEAASPEPDDDAALLKAQVGLLPLLTTDLDQLACLHEAAMAAMRLGRTSVAARYIEQARELRPLDFLTELFAYHLLDDDEPIAQAEALERVAQAANVQSLAADLWRTAGLAWKRAEDPARAADSWERCLALAPGDDGSFFSLRALYKETNHRDKLALLLEKRLALEPGDHQKQKLELELGHLWIELGASAKAKTLLEGTLARNPRDVVVLRLHAELAAELGDHRGAEQSLASLAASLDAGSERTAVYRALGRLYEKHFGALEKAMDAYQAALDESDTDLDLMRTLVSVYARLGLAERATQLQTELIQKAPLPDDKRREALELARLYEQVAGDPVRAGATLERTRRAWPLDQAVLSATAQFYERQGDQERARLLVEQTGAEARHKLETGKLDAGLLATLSAVADLSGKPQSRDAIAAARMAYLGEMGGFSALGPKALDPALDDLLAPPVLIAPLRNLIRKTSAALDAAFPIDLAPLDAQLQAGGPIAERLTRICEELGQPVPDVFVSPALGSRAVPLTTKPLRLIVGAELEELPEDSIDYLLARAVKLQQLGAGALARSRPEDAWPMIVALMSIFAPNYRPQGVDQRKILQARALVEQGLARTGYEPDVPALVLETINALRRQTEGLAEAPRLLVNRAAMLLAGGPGAALLAMSFGDKKPLPDGGPSRYRWIDAHAEAKDLILFCASDECATAIARATGGVRGRAPPPRAG